MNDRLGAPALAALARSAACAPLARSAQDGAAEAADRSASTPASTTSTPSSRRRREQREIGLMFRPSMPANDGMLFAFERPAQQCFWMKNTLIPLVDRLPRRRRQHRQHRRHEAADARHPLLGEAGALRARDERGLVRQARHQAGLQAARRAVRATEPARPGESPASALGDAASGSGEVLRREVPVHERAEEGLGPLRPRLR